MKRGRVLAIKWGMNPNSSSLGVDITFLLAGATAVALATPIIGTLLRIRAARLFAAAATAHDAAARSAHVPEGDRNTTVSDAAPPAT